MGIDTAQIEARLRELEINVAKQEAVNTEKHRAIMLSLERVETHIKKNSDSIEKLSILSSKGVGGLKLLVWVGTLIVTTIGYFKLKPYL